MRAFGILVPVFALALASASEGADTPYAGQDRRDIKALSTAQLLDISEGRGMGMALPAELNGFPGPSHTLELADKLGLTAAQRAGTQALFEAMKKEAKAAGAAYVQSERTLDRLFGDRQATPVSLEKAVLDAGQHQATLRLAHLKYHLAMVEILTPDQVNRYKQLRGYGNDGPAGGHHMHR